MSYLSVSCICVYAVKNSFDSAYQLFHEAAESGHVAAREWVALGALTGWGFYQSLSKAHLEFGQLAQEGNPRGQFGLGFMYANGLFVNVSVPHALVYLTFSALGGDEFAEMTMVSCCLSTVSTVSTHNPAPSQDTHSV